MEISSELGQLAVGSLGGAISEVMHWHRIARRGRWPKYARSLGYWVVTSLLIVSGGVVASAVSGPNASAIQLLLLGIVGPQLLQLVAQSKLTSAHVDEPHLGVARGTIVEFLST